MSTIFWAAVALALYGGGAYGTWALIDIIDDDPRDPAPMDGWWVALLWPIAVPAVGLMLLCSDLADKRRESRRG